MSAVLRDQILRYFFDRLRIYLDVFGSYKGASVTYCIGILVSFIVRQLGASAQNYLCI